MKSILLITGLLLLFAAEILRVYFIMPFPGSQHRDTLPFAYWLHNNIVWIRILALALLSYPAIGVLSRGRTWKKVLLSTVLALYAVIFYFFNFRFEADKMFYQPEHREFALAGENRIPVDKLVIGVTINGEKKAYPVQLIGYHHQVRDTVGGEPIMVTYCTVCRTGRVFSPVVNNRNETFRLVGMDHFNAMFEDASTKSWWQQATGVAVAGPLKGTALKEIPSRQMTLTAWLRQYPESRVFQRDTLFSKQYDDLAAYDKGTIKGSLEKRDSGSWKFKSWVIGVADGSQARAYDWNELAEKKMLQDSLPGLPLVILLEKDTASFRVWNRTMDGSVLRFVKAGDDLYKDAGTSSTWNMDGLCIDGPLKGRQLGSVRAYQEFWHSWRTFHPQTTKYE